MILFGQVGDELRIEAEEGADDRGALVGASQWGGVKGLDGMAVVLVGQGVGEAFDLASSPGRSDLGIQWFRRRRGRGCSGLRRGGR